MTCNTNSNPVARDDTASTAYNTAVTVNVLANDTDADRHDTLTISGTPSSDDGTVTVNSDGTLTFTPNAGFIGTTVISYTVSDGHGGTDTATLTISVSQPERDYVVEGTAGDDLIDYDYTGDPEGDMIDHSDNASHNNADLVTAGAGDDTVLAGAGNDTVYGEDGNDLLDGGAGNDVLSGGAGDDTFVGGAGDDTFTGGTGLDIIDYSNSESGLDIDLSTGQLSGGDAEGDSIAGGIDGIIGSEYADSLVGFNAEGTTAADTYTNVFYGGGGDDTIEGAGSGDSLYGGDDDDSILGGAGDDYIEGGADADYIDGGDDADTVLGGTGNDTIVGGAGADSLSGGDDRDTFLVASAGDGAGDVIDGNEGGEDQDTLDLTGAGPLVVTYDENNSENGTVTFYDDGHNVTGTLSFRNIENVIPCFTPGTMVATPRGERPVEALRAGDKVLTRDNGIQEIRWVGRRDLSRGEMQAAPHLRPILIPAGSLGCDQPERDMLVSPNHRMLVANERTALYFEEHEVLVAAKHLLGDAGVKRAETLGTSYIHFLFDRHEVVLANGAWTESFQPGDQTLAGMGDAQRAEIFEIFPELNSRPGREAFAAARKTLKRHEAALLNLRRAAAGLDIVRT